MRVVIAEDLALLRDGLERLLRESGFDVVAAVADADALSTPSPSTGRTWRSSTCGCRRRSATRACAPRSSAPPARPASRYSILSQYVEQTYAAELLADGDGRRRLPLKDRVSDVREFVDAVRRVAGGGMALDPEAVSQLVAGHDGGPLSQLWTRERAVLALMAEGRTNHGIADELEITPAA